MNHAASVITAKPLELPEDGRIMFTEESGLNFVGGEKTIQQFLQECVFFLFACFQCLTCFKLAVEYSFSP